MKRMLSYVVALAVLSGRALAAAESAHPPAATNRAVTKPVGDVPLNARVLMSPRSTLIERLGWTGPAHKLPGSGSDMHWHAWGADGALYVVDPCRESLPGASALCHAPSPVCERRAGRGLAALGGCL